MPPSDDEREKLREECHADLSALRVGGELPERAYRLLEKLVARLDRLETGEFPPSEVPTTPTTPERTRRASAGAMPAFRAETVIAELAKGKRG
jgi:hypothetical protein